MKDSACSMNVGLREAGAISVYHGRMYYFCSAEYKKQFVSDSKKYQNNVKAERMTIGVMGSAVSNECKKSRHKATILDEVITNNGLLLITGVKLIYERDPKTLADKLISAYEEQHFHKPSCFCSTP